MGSACSASHSEKREEAEKEHIARPTSGSSQRSKDRYSCSGSRSAVEFVDKRELDNIQEEIDARERHNMHTVRDPDEMPIGTIGPLLHVNRSSPVVRQKIREERQRREEVAEEASKRKEESQDDNTVLPLVPLIRHQSDSFPSDRDPSHSGISTSQNNGPPSLAGTVGPTGLLSPRSMERSKTLGGTTASHPTLHSPRPPSDVPSNEPQPVFEPWETIGNDELDVQPLNPKRRGSDMFSLKSDVDAHTSIIK